MAVTRIKRAPSAPKAPAVSSAGAGVTPVKPPGVTSNPGHPASPGVMGVNQNPASHQYGQQYSVQPTGGGVFHVYANGQKVFVPATTAPASGSAASQAAAAPPDPRDAQYYADTGQDTFDQNNAINTITTTGTRDQTDTQEAIRRLLENQPKAIQNAREGANKAGLFYSGKLGEQEGDINTQYARQSGDMQSDFDRRAADRTQAIAAINSGASHEAVIRLLEASGRATASDTTAADAGTLAPPDTATASGGPTVTGSAQTRTVKGQKQYRWPDGKWHTVPPKKK